MMNATNLLNRFQAAVEAKTSDALAGLAVLENQLAEALLVAEAAAAERIALECERMTSTFEKNLQAIQRHIEAMASSALERVIERLTAGVNAMTEAEQPAVRPSPVTEFAEPEPTATVAAHAVEAQAVGVLPEEDDLEDDQDQDGIDDAALLPTEEGDGIPTTSNPEGLHERRGNGRSVRYVPVALPEAGEMYHHKEGRRWIPVRFAST